ncbi:MAG TPA: extracellular solute-binding protein [Candidatus Binatia bacterium]|jgi:iron(III) transport system substrate-binding protein
MESGCKERAASGRAGSGARIVLGALLMSLGLPLLVSSASAGEETKSDWQREWERTVKAAEEEGQVALYSLSEVGEVFLHSAFQKRFPRIKLVSITARGVELVSRIMAERRAGKFLADVVNLGNTSPYRLYQAKVLDPITSAFLLPEVSDRSKWWQGKHHTIDPEGKYIFVFVGAPLYLIAYNSKLVKPNEFKSYWDLLNPKWKGKIAAFDLRAGGFAATRDRFFYYHSALGPEFLKRLYSEMDLTLYRQYPQGEDWLASGKFLLCLCRHQSISEAKTQGLPVDLVDPMLFKEGVGIETRAKTLALMNKAPHPNAAKVFINWFLSREGQIDFQKISTKYIDAGGEGSLRMDIPRDDIPLRNQLAPGVQYIPQWAPEMFDMKPIEKAVEEGLSQAGKK